MRNAWLVAAHAYRQTVLRRGFLIAVLAIPLGMALLITITLLVETSEGEARDTRPLGYVDTSTTVGSSLRSGTDDGIALRSFDQVAPGRAALEAGEIQALLVLPPDYPVSLDTDLYYLERPPSDRTLRQLEDAIRLELAAPLPSEVGDRVLQGPTLIVRDIASGREFSERGIINIILPFIASFLFTVTTMSASGYLLAVVADEKENRTVEVLLTSLTPAELIGGKSLGLLAAALTQLATYLLATVAALTIGARTIEPLQHVVIPWGYLATVTLFFLPAFALFAAVMVAIGSAVTDLQEGQQAAGLVNLLFLLPLLLLTLIFTNPGHPVAVAMTLFPATAFLTVSLRWGLGSIPLWQLVASWSLLLITTLAMIWTASRIFRLGMLRYGQPLSLRTVLTALRRRSGSGMERA